MWVDTLLAILSSLLSLLTARVILNYFSTVLLADRNLLTRLDSLYVFNIGSVITVQVCRSNVEIATLLNTDCFHCEYAPLLNPILTKLTQRSIQTEFQST